MLLFWIILSSFFCFYLLLFICFYFPLLLCLHIVHMIDFSLLNYVVPRVYTPFIPLTEGSWSSLKVIEPRECKFDPFISSQLKVNSFFFLASIRSPPCFLATAVSELYPFDERYVFDFQFKKSINSCIPFERTIRYKVMWLHKLCVCVCSFLPHWWTLNKSTDASEAEPIESICVRNIP